MAETDDAIVSYMPRAGVPEPMVVDGRTVLEPDSPVVWFTFPGAWHDIGRFHAADGAFTGFYANILTPVEITRRDPDRGPDRWDTTDLFLDVFRDPTGLCHVLDREELRAAEERGWVDAATARRAEAEATRLLAGAQTGGWPPAVVRDWTLDRARSAADG